MVHELEERWWLNANGKFTKALGIGIKYYSESELRALEAAIGQIPEQKGLKSMHPGGKDWSIYTDWYFNADKETKMPDIVPKRRKLILQSEEGELELIQKEYVRAKAFKTHLEAMVLDSANPEYGIRIREEQFERGFRDERMDFETQFSLEILAADNRATEYDFLIPSRMQAQQFLYESHFVPNEQRTKHKEMSRQLFSRGNDRYSVEINKVWILPEGTPPFTYLGTFLEIELRRPKELDLPKIDILEHIAQDVLKVPASNRERRRYRSLSAMIQKY